MTRGLELTRQFYENTIEGRTTAYRMVVRVSRAHEMDPNIFLYHRRQVAMGSDPAVDVFVCVCTPVDMEEYPLESDAVLEGYFRVADIDLIARSAAQLEDVWQMLQAARDELVRTLDALDAMTGTQTSAYGTLPESSSSSSSSTPEDGSSSEPEEIPATCSPVTYSALRVVYSTDPSFPVDTVLALTEDAPEVPDCRQIFSGTGVDAILSVRLYSVTGATRTYAAYKDDGDGLEEYSIGVAGDTRIIMFTDTYSVELVGE